MSIDMNQLERDVMKLSPEQRAALADKLWLSLEPQSVVDQAWAAEIERRIKDIDSGRVEPLAHEDVVAELRSRYGR
jgi:putative addiction module component (TIGR02574 family)